MCLFVLCVFIFNICCNDKIDLAHIFCGNSHDPGKVYDTGQNKIFESTRFLPNENEIRNTFLCILMLSIYNIIIDAQIF